MLYVTGPQNVAWAVDARSGRQIWRYRRELPPNLTACCGLVNRGFGVLGDKLFMTTLDAHLLALDMKTGAMVWDATLEDYKIGYASTLAPIVVKDKVIVGVAGGEYGIRGFIDAYDAQTGKRAWRFYTDSRPRRAGQQHLGRRLVEDRRHRRVGDRRLRPRAEPALYGTGNPGPDYHSDSREGDNLYSCSLVALDADTGKLKWHYQFTPHDVHDWDSTEVPILADLTIGGQPRKVVMFANRNGFYYTLDRTNGKLIVAKPFVMTTWAKEIGAEGRPVLLPGHTPDEKGEVTCPDLTGGTNFWPPSFDPRDAHVLRQRARSVRDLLCLQAGVRPGRTLHRRRGAARARAENRRAARCARSIPPPASANGNSVPDAVDVRACSRPRRTCSSPAMTKAICWRSTHAAASCCGAIRWARTLHGTSPITYMLDGRQHLLVPSGTTLTAWALELGCEVRPGAQAAPARSRRSSPDRRERRRCLRGGCRCGCECFRHLRGRGPRSLPRRSARWPRYGKRLRRCA